MIIPNMHYADLKESYLFYIASIVDMPIVVSSRTSRRTFTVSRDVSIVTLFWLAQRRIKTPSA